MEIYYRDHIILEKENGFEIDGKTYHHLLFAKDHVDTIKQQEKAYQDENGVWRWQSNDRVPPEDVLEKWNLSDDIMQKCLETKDQETHEFLAKYREQMKNHVPSDEEIFEMRAAFGPGATVVNVITGKKINL